STTKYNPWLPPPAISVIATTSEEHENHNDNQNGCHSFFPKCTSEELPSCIWVRNNYVTSLGIYLVLPIASGWFVATLCSPPRSSWAGFSYKHLDEGGEAVSRKRKGKKTPQHEHS